MSAAEQARRYQEQQRALVLTPPKPPMIEPLPQREILAPAPPPPRPIRPNIPLVAVAFGLAAVGLTINGWYARSLGSTDVAGWLFLAMGVASDLAAFFLPDRAIVLWRSHQRFASAIAWALWLATFAFALLASDGFASLNIADTTMARANRTTPAITEIERSLSDARRARDQECVKLGPICRQRQDAVAAWQRKLDEARQAVEAVSDPQPRLVADLRLGLLVMLPQVGGLVLLVARAR